ncbi:ABC transporter ATP-binding protein [Thermogymnomonas acidicola]|uniref:ABC transporter ATP-binding protein n=1 Tax=Thermogymnomonas acidicola TaxID=399579 RepID=UPI001396B910|nr:ABC transporter ATP-binding protein [Thermogymnomonas acidicola]
MRLGSFSVRDVTIPLEKGRINGIGGKNGSGGKSTLLRAIYGYLRLDRGAILIDGREIGEYSERERASKISVVHQEHPEPISFRVRDIVSLYGTWSGSSLSLESVAARTGIAHLMDRDFSTLSGGEKRLVMIAAALYQDTEFVLMDEPTAFLDVDRELLVYDLIRQASLMGKTVVVVLHDVNSLAALCHRITFMKEGQVVAHGRPEEVLRTDILERVYDTGFTVRDGIFVPVRRDLSGLRVRVTGRDTWRIEEILAMHGARWEAGRWNSITTGRL